MTVNHDIQSDSLQQEDFNVRGMSCSSCASRVEKILVMQKGVKSASVNLEAASVRVEFDPALSSPQSMQQAVKMVGYDFQVNS